VFTVQLSGGERVREGAVGSAVDKGGEGVVTVFSRLVFDHGVPPFNH
jgi:hypothetical protein